MRRDSAMAWAAFRERVTALGGTVLESAWLGKGTPHRIRCASGHLGSPRPGDVRQGKGICRTCAGQDPASADQRFRERVAALGGDVLEPTWLGNHKPHLVRCALGHEVRPTPANVSRGQGICRVCAIRDPVAAERAFREFIGRLGGTVLEQPWRGSDAPHAAICPVGHECLPRHSGLLRGEGMCRTCAGNDPVRAERGFRDRVAALGGCVVEETWLGNKSPHRVICAAGHDCHPRPNDVQQGGGICRACAGRQWDVFYVVTHPGRQHLKFGITSGDPRPRLGAHATAGFSTVTLVLEGLQGAVAPELEAMLVATLPASGFLPVRGREYFASAALPVVLDLAASSLGAAA